MRLFKKIVLLTLLLLAGVAGAHAEQLLKTKPGYSNFKFQPFWAHYSYDEYDKDGSHFINSKGETGGLALQWQYFLNNSNVILIPLDAEIYGGTELTYTGAISNENGYAPYGSLVKKNEQFLFFTIRSLTGYNFAITINHAINLLAGFGYHFTYNQRTSMNSYDRINHQFYVPVALEYQYQTGIFSVTTHAEYDIFLVGLQYSYFQSQYSVDRGYVDTDIPIDKQTKGWGTQLFAEFNIDNFLITPFFNYFWVGESTSSQNYTTAINPSLYGAEPENTTITTGVKFGYRF